MVAGYSTMLGLPVYVTTKNRLTVGGSTDILCFIPMCSVKVWRDQELRSLLLDSCIDFVSNSFLTAFMIPSLSITLNEGSDTFI